MIKADGLAAGKGVVVATSLAEAEAAVDDMLGGRFGAASAEIVVEEFLRGRGGELLRALRRHHRAPLGTAQDHKRAFDGDPGRTPAAWAPFRLRHPRQAMTERAMATIVRPTLAEMARRGTPFRGFLYAGLMVSPEGPRLIEYNCRFGDPECQVVMPRLMTDLVTAMLAARDGVLANFTVRLSPRPAIGVVVAAKGYPGEFRRGEPILGIEAAAAIGGVTVFQAGTRNEGERLVSNGGRVLTVVGEGATFIEAHRRAYAGVAAIDWPGGFCRSDIGARALAREADPPFRTAPSQSRPLMP